MTVSEQIQQENPKSGISQRLWDLISRPSSSIIDRADRREVRTLSAFLFAFFFLTATRLIVGLISGSYLAEPEPFITVVILNLLILFSYILSRTKYYAWGSGIAIVSTIVTVLITIILRGDYESTRVFSTLMWLIPALILGSAFFSWQTTTLISIFTLGTILLMPVFIPGMEMDAVLSGFSILFVVSFLVVLVDRFRDQLEVDRQAAINVANQELELASQLLEQRVNQRTRDLKLAAEISRALAQITDLDELLQESVERIRTQFELYYAQIYLVDMETSSLTLRAGTGNVGQELVRRGHRLVVGPGSINGTAVSEKRAVIVSDTATNLMFRPNALLPHTRSELALPLVIGDRVVGVLNLQGAEANALTEDNLPAFESLGGQLAVAIENAKLLSEAAEARAEIESFTRRISRQGWDSYLDAVSHPRFLGYSFDTDNVTPLSEPISQDLGNRNVAQVPIDVVGETVGAIQIEAEDDRIWTVDDLDLIQSVAIQVGQQVEMLRSLDEAAQYRQEAEKALRRVTHEAWLTYEETPELASGYAYDQVEVKPTTAVSPSDDSPHLVHHDLAMHGEAIGELAFSKPERFDQAFTDELVTAVASQLVTHMENLRLSEQTEHALANAQRRGRELSVINAVALASADINTIQDFLATVQSEVEQLIPINSFTTSIYNEEENSISFAYAYDDNAGKLENPPPITLEPHHLSYKTIKEAVPQIIHFTAEEVEEQKNNRPPNLMSEDASVTSSLLFVPLISGQEVIGVISAQSYELNAYRQEHIDLLSTVAGYITTAIQKAQLFEQTQARAEELAVINEVAQIVSQQIAQEEIMQAVYEQVQRILPTDTFFIALHNTQTDNIDYPYWITDNQTQAHQSDSLKSDDTIYQVFQSAKPTLIHKTPKPTGELGKNPQEKTSASLMYIPLSAGQEVLGILSVQTHQANAYDQGSLDLMAGIANHVALSLENTRLLQNTQRTAEREQVLRAIAATINTSIDAESVLQTAAREIGRALGAETYVYLRDTTQAHVKNSTNNNNGEGNGR